MVFPINVNPSINVTARGSSNGKVPSGKAPNGNGVTRTAPRKRAVKRRAVHRAKAVKRQKKDTGILGAAEERAKGPGGKGSWNDWQSDAANRKQRKVRDRQGFLVP